MPPKLIITCLGSCAQLLVNPLVPMLFFPFLAPRPSLFFLFMVLSVFALGHSSSLLSLLVFFLGHFSFFLTLGHSFSLFAIHHSSSMLALGGPCYGCQCHGIHSFECSFMTCNELVFNF
jgi:hypothetical protein